MLLIFGGFAVWFYFDASTGYRKKNLEYYLHQTFEHASGEFSRMNADGTLTAEAWKSHAAKQVVKLPKDASVLPTGTNLPMPWPAVLHDFDRMKPLNWKELWLDYSKNERLSAEPAEKPYDARTINEQWLVAWICVALALAAVFVLVRTLRRTICADGEALTSQQGRRILYSDLKTLDLRKWETKGLAFLDYDGASGKGRVRIDGLTYGGFKKEEGEPAEQLMRIIRSHFSGEILEYAPILTDSTVGEDKPNDS